MTPLLPTPAAVLSIWWGLGFAGLIWFFHISARQSHIPAGSGLDLLRRRWYTGDLSTRLVLLLFLTTVVALAVPILFTRAVWRINLRRAQRSVVNWKLRWSLWRHRHALRRAGVPSPPNRDKEVAE